MGGYELATIIMLTSTVLFLIVSEILKSLFFICGRCEKIERTKHMRLEPSRGMWYRRDFVCRNCFGKPYSWLEEKRSNLR